MHEEVAEAPIGRETGKRFFTNVAMKCCGCSSTAPRLLASHEIKEDASDATTSHYLSDVQMRRALLTTLVYKA